MSQSTNTELPLLDVRPIAKPQRHPLIFGMLEALAVGESFVVLNDHNPIPLRGQVESFFGNQFAWRYLEEGPEIFRLQFRRDRPAPEGFVAPDPTHPAPPRGAGGTVLPVSDAAAAPVAPPKPEPAEANLLDLCRNVTRSGPQWSHESHDLDVTLLSWESGRAIAPHVNNEVDVIWLGIDGEGIVTIDGVARTLQPGVLLLIPKGCERSAQASSPRFSYLSLHQRRRGLLPTLNGVPLSN
jgi:uncharacterized protein (DUF2249 family)/quercetin dioxygenase-like cupin family protein